LDTPDSIDGVKHLVTSIALSVAFALIGGLFAGDALGGWFQDLEQPWYALPLWDVVGGLSYIMTTTLLYRLFQRPSGWRRRGSCPRMCSGLPMICGGCMGCGP
jgi:hypothetical protein